MGVSTEPRIWQDSLDAARWIRDHVKGQDPLSLRLHQRVFDLVEAAALALRPSGDRLVDLDRLDRANTVLRANLRVAEHANALTAGEYAAITEILDGLGRQVGGWIRKEEVSLERQLRR